MKLINFLLVFLLSTASATEFAPWFPPPFEIESHFTALYERVEQVQSPLGSFSFPINNGSARASFDLTPWPLWNVEAELYLTHTHKVNFAYEAALLTLRRSWLDDITGDPVSLVTGVTLSFPGHQFLHQFSFPYHGIANAEFHATVGKEWAHCQDWLFRFWSLAGFGVACRGSPWLHGVAVAEARLSCYTSAGLFVESLCGFGKHNIIPHTPFKGYGPIAHRNVDLGAFYSYGFSCLGTLSVFGWYNLYAHNFIQNYWGFALSLLVPFSIL